MVAFRSSYKPKPRVGWQTTKREHGLTQIEARAMTAGKTCAICGCRIRLVVDHNHYSGSLRDVLCSQCNTGIGLFAESPERLSQAAAYLVRWNTPDV